MTADASLCIDEEIAHARAVLRYGFPPGSHPGPAQAFAATGNPGAAVVAGPVVESAPVCVWCVVERAMSSTAIPAHGRLWHLSPCTRHS